MTCRGECTGRRYAHTATCVDRPRFDERGRQIIHETPQPHLVDVQPHEGADDTLTYAWACLVCPCHGREDEEQEARNAARQHTASDVDFTARAEFPVQIIAMNPRRQGASK